VGGAASLDEVYSFVVEDRTAPRVVGAQALAQKTVRVAFDEPVLVPSGGELRPHAEGRAGRAGGRRRCRLSMAASCCSRSTPR
jgi:hypothetical protein